MPSNCHGRGAIALLLALCGLAALGLVLLLKGDAKSPELADHGARRAAAPADDGPTVETIARVPETGGSAMDAREGATSTQPPPAAKRRVRLGAMDAASGRTLVRFWVRSSGFGELGAPTMRWNSDAAGAAELDFDGPPPPLLVMAAGYQPTEILVGAADEQIARLPRSPSIVGTVRDAASAPLRAARVTLEYLGDADTPSPGSEAVEPPEGVATLRRTDEAGAYVFSNLPPGLYRTRVTVGGVERVSAPSAVRLGQWTTLDHWLDEERRLVLEVLRPDGLPSEATRILVTRLDPSPGDPTPEAQNENSPQPLLARYTDPYGVVTLGPLVPHTYQVTVISDHGAHPELSVTIPDAGTRTIHQTITLDPPGTDR